MYYVYTHITFSIEAYMAIDGYAPATLSLINYAWYAIPLCEYLVTYM